MSYLTPPPSYADRPAGRVIAFPAAAARRAKPPVEGEGRGEILLFLGVRYERQADAPVLPRRAHS